MGKDLITLKAKSFINRILLKLTGFYLTRSYSAQGDQRLSLEEKNIISKVKDRTMTNSNSISNLIQATRYILKSGIDGAFVECGVWRGGSAMAFCYSALAYGQVDREIYLMDTFAGYTKVTDKDFQISNGQKASELFNLDANYICQASLEDVKLGIRETNYPSEKVFYLVGDIIQSSLSLLPDKIAILRLDTDYYESTLWSLENLYPLVPKGGIIIIDDYDYWNGCREACDEFFSKKNDINLMIHMEYGRMLIKND